MEDRVAPIDQGMLIGTDHHPVEGGLQRRQPIPEGVADDPEAITLPHVLAQGCLAVSDPAARRAHPSAPPAPHDRL